MFVLLGMDYVLEAEFAREVTSASKMGSVLVCLVLELNMILDYVEVLPRKATKEAVELKSGTETEAGEAKVIVAGIETAGGGGSGWG
ncbi:hypothetical protein VTN96DRAFT_3507 [Rasamsonia emersonii]